MKTVTKIPWLKGFRSAREIIVDAIMVTRKFALNTAEVEDMLATKRVVVSWEVIFCGSNVRAQFDPP